MVILKIKTHYLGYFLDDSKLLCKRLLNQNMIKSCKSLVHNYICTFFIFIKGITKIITRYKNCCTIFINLQFNSRILNNLSYESEEI